MKMSSVPSQKELRAQYRKQAKEAHPDLKGTQTKFKQLSSAYSFLLDYIANNSKQNIPNEVHAKDISHSTNIVLTFEEACTGILKKILFERIYMTTRSGCCELCWGRGWIIIEESIMTKCSVCRVQPKVVRVEKMIRVPAGIKNNQKLIFESEGHMLDNVTGSLRVNVTVKKDATRARDNCNIVEKVFVTYSDLLLCKKIIAKTIHGDQRVEIPFGSFDGDTLRLKEKGVHTKKKLGDHLVKLCLIAPQRLTPDQTKVLQDLQRVGL